MLVLSRQRNEIIMIGDDIEVEVVDIKKDKVQLRIKAPDDIPVHRHEVYSAIKQNQEEEQPHPHRKKGGGLVLSRQREDSIMIGDDTQILVIDIRGDKVRLGIVAPRRIPVHRKEIYDDIKQK